MTEFNYIKWVTNNKHSLLTEQAVTSSVTGSNTGSVTGSNPVTSSQAPSCYYCDTGSAQQPSPSFVNSAPAFYYGVLSSGVAYYGGYAYTANGDCIVDPSSGATGQGNLNQNTVQANCGNTPPPPPTSSMQVCYGCVNNQIVDSGGIQFNPQSNGYCGTMSSQGVTTTYYYPQTHPQLANCGISPSSCDNSPTSPCAQQWFGNNANNFASWMSSKDCSTYNQIPNNLALQIGTLFNNRPNMNVTWTSPQNWNDIKNLANSAGFTQPQKGQFKRKLAKMAYAICMIQSNCCTT